MASLTRNHCEGTVPGALTIAYYKQRAAHAGLIKSEGLLVTPQGSEWSYAVHSAELLGG